MAKINNILNDREAREFLGVKNVQSIVSKFMSHENAQSKQGCWHVSELCRVYGISDYYASEKLQKLFRAGRITGPLLIGR
jgi:hypothetical protein